MLPFGGSGVEDLDDDCDGFSAGVAGFGLLEPDENSEGKNDSPALNNSGPNASAMGTNAIYIYIFYVYFNFGKILLSISFLQSLEICVLLLGLIITLLSLS